MFRRAEKERADRIRAEADRAFASRIHWITTGRLADVLNSLNATLNPSPAQSKRAWLIAAEIERRR